MLNISFESTSLVLYKGALGFIFALDVHNKYENA
jgi:hypothetical protein